MMAVLNQFRRIYSDNGSGDRDFSVQEEQLRLAQQRLTESTKALVRSSQNLNDVLLANGLLPGKNIIH